MKKLPAIGLSLLACVLSFFLWGAPLPSGAEELADTQEVPAVQADRGEESSEEGDTSDPLYVNTDDSSEGAEASAPEQDADAGVPADATEETSLEAQASVYVGYVGTYDDADSGFTYTYEVLTAQTNPDGSTTGTVKLIDMDATSGAFDDVDNPYGTVDVTLPSRIDGLTVVELGEGSDGYPTFEGHPYLRSIVIPNTVTKLNGSEKDGQLQKGGLWQYGYNLEEIAFEKGSTVSEIPPGFFSRTKISSIVLPDTVKSIGNYAFMNCANLTEVNMPASLETIGDYAFCSTSLTHVDFPSKLRTIGNYAFSKKIFYTQETGWEPESYTLTVELDSVNLPNTVTSIGAYAFATDGGAYANGDSYEGLSDIGEITLGTSLKTIGEGAFSGCSVEELVLPNTLTTLGKDAFSVSPWLESVRFADMNRAQLTTLTGFNTCRSLTEVEVPTSVTAISDEAFRDCQALPSIALPPSVEEIGAYAFDGCSALASIVLPSNLTTVKEWTFAYCTSLTTTGLNEGVESIGEGAYLGCSSLGEVTIPSTVNHIGQQAFAGSSITQLTIATGNTPLTIGARCFRGCDGLSGSTVELPKRVSALGAEAFLYSNNVTFKIYNDALVIGTDDEAYGGYNYIDGELTEADLGSLFSSDLSTSGGSDDNGNPYYSYSMDDPWGGSSRDMRQDILNRVSNPASSKVLYPNTLSNETSPTFDVYVKCIANQFARYGTGGTGYGPWKYVWPTFEAFDAGGGQVDPGPDDPDPDAPVDIEEAAKGTLQVYTTGAGGIKANVCVFDASGALVASAQAPQGYTFMDSLEPGTYTVVAFAYNDRFSTVGSLADFGTMGFTMADYAKKENVAIAEDKTTEVTLSVPAIDATVVSSLLDEGGVVLAKKRAPQGVEVFATVNYAMASGKKANTLVVSVPKGLDVTSVASGSKNYGTSGFNKTTRKLTLSLSGSDAQTGRIWVGLKATAVGSYSINASVVSNKVTAPVGSATLTCYGIDLDLPTEDVNGTSFEATIHARPGSTATIKVADKTFTFGPTNRTGSYTGTIDLGDFSTLGMDQLVVHASLEDGETYTATGTVTVRTLVEDTGPRLWEFYFLHATSRNYLVREGQRYRQDYYTYMAFGNDRPSYKTWTFVASYVSPTKLEGSATVQVQMLDGTSRYQQMSLKSQEQQDDGTWKATFTTAMYIEQAGNHVFSDTSLIPTAFDVLYSYDIDPDTVDDPGELTQPEIDLLRGMLKPLTAWKQEVSKKTEEIFGPDDEEYDEDEDALWPLFHSYMDDPRLVVIINKLPEETKQEIAGIDEDVITCSGGGEELMGFETPARECDNSNDYMTANMKLKMNQMFDAASLMAQGYQLIKDAGAASAGTTTGTPTGNGGMKVPEQVAVRPNTDSKGKITSISYADSNGNTAEHPMPDLSKKFKPLKQSKVAPPSTPPSNSMDNEAFCGHVAQECTNRGYYAQELEGFIAANYKQLGLTSSEAKYICKYLSKTGDCFTVLGFAAGTLQAKHASDRWKENEERIADVCGTVDNLKIWEHYVGSNLQKYSLACYQAIKMQREAAERLLASLENVADFEYKDTIVNAVNTAIGAAPGGFGTTIAFFSTNLYNLATGPMKSFNQKQLANRLKRFIDATKFRYEVCGGTDGHDAGYGMSPILDPAGTVYEAVPSNLLPGVTATVVNASNGEVWDAEAYDQVNPQVTGDDGAFQWDVPSGSWKVRFEKKGYETAETDALQVPPPQLGLSFGMVATAAPTVKSVTAGTDYAEIVFSQYMDCGATTTVSVAGKAVDASLYEWVDPEEGADGKQLSCVLRVPVPEGTKVGSSVKVSVSMATNYAGKSLSKTATKTVKAQMLPATIEFNFDETISLQVGVARPTAVRVYDRAGNPVEGATITASLDNSNLATVDATGAKTDAEGVARVQLEALLPGYSTLTVGVEGTSLTREITLLTTVDSNQTARPVAKVGGTTIDEGAPAEATLNVAATDVIELSCATEGATIYYTTDGSCPCQRTEGRHEYTGPIVVGEGGTFIIASYKDGMDYSERLTLKLTASGKIDLSKAQVAKISDQVWFGKALEPELTVTYNGGVVPSSSYDVTFANNDHPGTATATLKGKGVCQGTKSAKFKVVLPFKDVTWTASGAGATAHLTDILWLADAGITKGWGDIPNAEFRPNANVKRGDMAAFLFRLAKLWGVGDASDDWQPNATTKAKFTDVKESTSHAQAIWWMAENGISAGWDVGGGKAEFRPNNDVKRGDLAAFLGRLAKLAGRGTSVKGNQSAFIDVSAKTSHAEEIWWMAGAGISTGWTVSGGAEFRPNAEVKRGDMAAFLQRLNALK